MIHLGTQVSSEGGVNKQVDGEYMKILFSRDEDGRAEVVLQELRLGGHSG